MKIKVKDTYADGSEMEIRESQLTYDLRRRGYDTEHIDYIIDAIYEKAKRDGDSIENDDLASVWQQGGTGNEHQRIREKHRV